MGIKNLSKLIADHAPHAIKEVEFKSLFGRKIAIDASMAIYQFLIAIRQTSTSAMMVNEQGKDTSHLVGLFYRTTKMLENGIKPIYVFDGKAPELKIGELNKRKERRKDAEEKLLNAETEEDRAKMKKRLVKVTRQHNDDCKRLLQLLGCPVVTSPSEAEAQCAQLCKEGLVYAIATEDMDGLTFAAPKLIRNLSSGRSDEKAKEYTFSKVLEGLEIDYDQFVDLCILMGCDYCDSINGIGGKKGLDLIKTYGSIEKILETKYDITEFLDVEVQYSDKREQNDEELNKVSVFDQSELNVDASIVVENSTEKKDDKENSENKETNSNTDDVKKEKNDDEIDEEELKKEKNDDEIKKEELKKEKNDDVTDEEAKDESKISIKEDIEMNDDDEIKEEEDEPKSETEEVEEIKSKKPKREKKDPVPKNWLFRGARLLFKEPNVLVNQFTEADLKFKDLDEEGLLKFLCEENGFNEDRVKPAINRVKQAKTKTNQSRIDSFFKSIPQDNKSKPNTSAVNSKKRPSTDSSSSKNKRGKKK